MSALDVLRSFAESREPDSALVPGLTYGHAREIQAELEDLQARCSEAVTQESMVEQARRLLREVAKVPPKQRFAEMVQAGLIDEEGRYLG